jgi:DNA-binding NarL/FixJ family response regulator
MPPPSKYHIRLLVADDHEMLREGFHTMLKKYPEIELIGEARNGEELVDLTGKLHPDVIITDIKMPRLDGIDATRMITKKFPACRIIAFTMFDEEVLIVDMLEAGARGYLVKTAAKEEIIEAIHTVMENKTYYCRETTSRLANLIAKSQFDLKKGISRSIFTERETVIIRMICEGLSNKEIASGLQLSMRTVEGHRERILEKMDVKNTAGIVVFAIRAGIYSIHRK